MEGEGSILDAILGEDVEDLEMMDIEERELVGLEGELDGLDLRTDPVQNIGGDVDSVNQEAYSKNCKLRRKKKKKSRKKKSQDPEAINIDRFVLDVCKRLNERKTHMMYAAVGCLGISALSDLIKEVYAIQACGGQKIANGQRYRNGGGILWNVLKTRDPNAYKEIMKKTKEFEKQFRQQRQGLTQNKEVSSEKVQPKPTNKIVLDCQPHVDVPLNQSNVEEKRVPVRDRIRMPVTYDDLAEEDCQNTQTT